MTCDQKRKKNSQLLYKDDPLHVQNHAFLLSKKIIQTNGNYVCTKGQLNSEWIYEVIVSSKMPNKNFKDFCLGSLLFQG